MARGKGEGSVHFRPDKGLYVAQIVVDGQRRTFYGPDKKTVLEKLQATQEAARKALPVPPARLTFGQYLTTYLDEVAPKRVTASTLRGYRAFARLYIQPALGRYKLQDVTPQRLQALLNGLAAKGLGPDSERYCRAVVRVVLTQAQREGLVALNVAKLVTTSKQQRKRVAAMQPAQAKAIVAAFADHPLQTLVVTSLLTGLRQGEALGLGWDDVDLDAATLRVNGQLQRVDGQYLLTPPKTAQSRRTLALPPLAVETLRQQKRRQAELRLRAGSGWQETGRVFTTADGGYLNGSWVTHAFQRRLRERGLPVLSWHQLRHGHATLLLAQAVAMKTVSEQLGHSQISVTMDFYAHVAPELFRDAAVRLDEALGG